jgi:hypothetical protein
MSTPHSKSCIEITQQPVVPDANGYTWLFDSTHLSSMQQGVVYSLGKSAAVPTPGPERGGTKNMRIMMTAQTVTQNCSLVEFRLNGAGAWCLYDTIALVAGDTPQAVNWTVASPDAMIGFLAGATPPSAINTTFLMTEQP